MALLNLKLNIIDKYKLLINDILKYLTIFVVFQYMMSCSKFKIKNPLTNGFMNDNIIIMLLYIILGIMTYYLIVDELIEII